MTEPTTSTAAAGPLLLAALTAALGPLLGQWMLILVGGFVGSFLAVTAIETVTLGRACIVLARGVGMSGLFSGLAVVLLAPHVGASVDLLLLPVAGLIGWKQDRLLSLVESRFGAKKEAP